MLTLPFWVLGAAVDMEIAPGLPLSGLAVLCPAAAAGILSVRAGPGNLQRWLADSISLRKTDWRWLIAALINPLLFGLAFVLARQSGADIPDPVFGARKIMLLFAMFLPAAWLEEAGWSAYATPRLQARFGMIPASLLLGLFWAVWHYPALIQADRSAIWIAWWSLWTVSARVIMVWLYNWCGRSALVAVLYHALSNLCWQLYPVDGSWFDPKISGLLTLALALCLVFSRAGRNSKMR
ncbi:MAG: CPBP family intramembrane glutamic endopeptidase [Hyphomonas sp.]